VPADAIVAALGSEQIDHPTRRQPGRGGPQGPPVRFEVVNAGSIADAAQLLIEAVPAGCFCAGCEAIVTAADSCCKCAKRGTISRELRQGRDMQLLSLQLRCSWGEVASILLSCSRDVEK
jgi:hydrogenase nickel incorporation protein HypA/HybF